ncbi:hypothetical protein EI94DRAFT_1804560 [Lactarius quietus]|nr:hypothetical protein EI94DRAFT_1804560 [Lactarius quietus]
MGIPDGPSSGRAKSKPRHPEVALQELSVPTTGTSRGTSRANSNGQTPPRKDASGGYMADPLVDILNG